MNAQKKITCHVCGRRFATQQALHQHQQAMHGAGTQRVPVGAARKPRARRARGTNRSAMGTAQVPISRITPTQGVTVNGFERLGSLSMTTNAKASWQVNAFMVPRLAAMSAAFQRIKFLSLRLSVTAYGSAMGTGGYVVGFVADPSDKMPSIDQLQSQAGARACKIWENVDVPLTIPNTLYYTSQDNELRWYSPGRIVAIMDGSVTSGGRLVMNLHWNVHLSVPTVGDTTTTPRTLTISNNLVVIKGKNIMGWKSGNSYKGDCRPVMSAIPYDGQFLQCPQFSLEYKEGVGDTGSIPVNFLKYSASDGTLTVSNDGISVLSEKWQVDLGERVVLVAGVEMRIVYDHPAPSESDFQQLASNSNQDGISGLNQCPEPSGIEAMINQLSVNCLNLSSRHSEVNSKILSLELSLSSMERVLMRLVGDSSTLHHSRSQSSGSIKPDSLEETRPPDRKKLSKPADH